MHRASRKRKARSTPAAAEQVCNVKLGAGSLISLDSWPSPTTSYGSSWYSPGTLEVSWVAKGPYPCVSWQAWGA